RRFLDIGYIDERYYPGGAEDYDFCCRASMRGYRSVGTTKSWVCHNWSKTLNAEDAMKIKETVDDDLRFGNHNEVWCERFDIWGIKCLECDNRLRTTDNLAAICVDHPSETYIIPESQVTQL